MIKISEIPLAMVMTNHFEGFGPATIKYFWAKFRNEGINLGRKKAKDIKGILNYSQIILARPIASPK